VAVDILFEQRGVEDYQIAHRHQRETCNRVINKESVSTLISVVHPPVITIGRKGSREDILADPRTLEQKSIQVIEVERGGKVTYHGPGQIVMYPIFDLALFEKDISVFLRTLEKVVIYALNGFGIDAEPGDEAGIFTQNKKIGSIGIAVKKWVSWHGLSLNVKKDTNFNLINPCGFSPDIITSLEEQGTEADLERVEQALISSFEREFGIRFIKQEIQQ
jgi:lipoyl(octanoyl) transferase